MNERIKELAIEAAMECIDPNGPYTADEVIAFRGKFAELIIFECTKAVQDGTMSGDHYAQRIEEHFNDSPSGILQFGVEE
jgi:hypothetical protein